MSKVYKVKSALVVELELEGSTDFGELRAYVDSRFTETITIKMKIKINRVFLFFTFLSAHYFSILHYNLYNGKSQVFEFRIFPDTPK
ncbi:hypothetical protein KAU33_00700, partial [Candidatus Dependentiae bacterium]|nr:hypothetical protein [Candidatus Dependentiae bacterium]